MGNVCASNGRTCQADSAEAAACVCHGESHCLVVDAIDDACNAGCCCSGECANIISGHRQFIQRFNTSVSNNWDSGGRVHDVVSGCVSRCHVRAEAKDGADVGQQQIAVVPVGVFVDADHADHRVWHGHFPEYVLVRPCVRVAAPCARPLVVASSVDQAISGSHCGSCVPV